jgi:hypothetical protein
LLNSSKKRRLEKALSPDSKVHLTVDPMTALPEEARDFMIAIDKNRSAKQRLAAIDRFRQKIEDYPFPYLLDFLTGRKWPEDLPPKSKGRKRDPSTTARIKKAAQLLLAGASQRKMAQMLFPTLSQEDAYARTRGFFSKFRPEIEREKQTLLKG